MAGSSAFMMQTELPTDLQECQDPLRYKYFQPLRALGDERDECVREHFTYHLPNLKDVVFRYATHHPRLIGVPGKVRNLGRVTSMDKL